MLRRLLIQNNAVGHLLTHCSASFVRRHETQFTMRPCWASRRAREQPWRSSLNPMIRWTSISGVNHERNRCDETHAATIDALNELAASLIRSGAPVDAVQKFVDAEIDRIEFMEGKTR